MVSGLAAFAVLAAIAITVGSAVHQMRTAAEIERQQRARARRLAANLRQLGRECLDLKRSSRGERDRRDLVVEEIAGLDRRIHELRQAASTLVVFDERKVMGDRLWRVPAQRVVSGDLALPWRTYLVWASGPDRALGKLRARYPNPDRIRLGEPREQADLPRSA
jgi:hypothetical protein